MARINLQPGGEDKRLDSRRKSYEMYTQKQIDQALSKYEELKSVTTVIQKPGYLPERRCVNPKVP